MINLTTEAAKQALHMMQENDIDPGTSQYGLRGGSKAGGCSGLNYVLDIVDAHSENDRVFHFGQVRIYCDPKSYLYLNGTQIDFEQNMMGGGFKFTNPNAKRSCGCVTRESAAPTAPQVKESIIVARPPSLLYSLPKRRAPIASPAEKTDTVMASHVSSTPKL